MLQDHPERVDILVVALNQLTRMVATQKKLRPEDERSIADALAGVFENIGVMLMPEVFKDVVKRLPGGL